MLRRLLTAGIVLACLVSLVVPSGCRSVFATGSYSRIARSTLDGLAEEARARILSVIAAHSDPLDRGKALWAAAREFEAEAEFEAALVAYKEISATGALPQPVLDERIRWCRSRLTVDRRWADDELRKTASQMKLSAGLGLYREVARTIAANYVDDVPYQRLLESGLENLRAAVDSPAFRKQFGVPEDPAGRGSFLAAMESLSRKLKEEKEMTSFTARYYVRRACEENEATLALPDGVVISEFIFAAAEHLDTYSAYLTHPMYEAVIDDLQGSFVGLGIEIRKDKDALTIAAVFEGGPASRADLRPGDAIIAVDGRQIADIGMDEIVKSLRGKEGTAVNVTVRRGDETKVVTVVRGAVHVPSVRQAARVGDGKRFGYVQLAGFQRGTGVEVSRAISRLEDDGPLAGLVLDLRDNPGGLLDAAVDVCSLFLEQGEVVSTQGRGFGQTRSYRVSHWRLDCHDEMPLVVLVNGSSASASEIVVAALKDHKRARVVGSRTFGKGIVQSILPVEAGQSAVYLTTARFLGPSGTCFHGLGIEPDVAVQPADEAPAASRTADAATDAALRKALELLGAAQGEQIALTLPDSPTPATH